MTQRRLARWGLEDTGVAEAGGRVVGESETVGLLEFDGPVTPIGVDWVPTDGAHATLISATAALNPTQAAVLMIRTLNQAGSRAPCRHGDSAHVSTIAESDRQAAPSCSVEPKYGVAGGRLGR